MRTLYVPNCSYQYYDDNHVVPLATTQAAVFFAAFGYVIYVGVYSLYMKRNSVYGTFVGSLSGAVPPVVGYCAVTGQLIWAH